MPVPLAPYPTPPVPFTPPTPNAGMVSNWVLQEQRQIWKLFSIFLQKLFDVS
jgi:hypothetical protein